MIYLTFVNVMLDTDAVINNSSQKVGGSNAYQDPTPKKWVGSDPEKHIGSTPLRYVVCFDPLVKIYGNAAHGLVT